MNLDHQIDKGTTIYIDFETKNWLKSIAKKNGRTILGQLRWMLEKEEKVSHERIPVSDWLEKNVQP